VDEEDGREIVPVFVWKMGTREQQFPGVGELAASRAASARVSGAATCILQTSSFHLKMISCVINNDCDHITD